MIRRSRVKTALSAVVTKRNLPTVSAFSLSCALLAGWGYGASFTGCAAPAIVDPLVDLGMQPNNKNDGGTTTTPPASQFTATPKPSSNLVLFSSNFKQVTDYKRDPSYVEDGTDQYLFAACSGASIVQWSICSFKLQTTVNPPTWAANGTQPLLAARSTQWDGFDLTAPTVVIGGGSAKFTMWYAANGSNNNAAGPKRPAYVTQIGRATSNDGVTWVRSDNPVLDLPLFSGTSVTDTPMADRPDAYGATDPFVLVDGSNYILYYAGLDCKTGTCIYRILRSVSTDGGNTFPPGTVVLNPRANVAEEAGGVAGPSVVKRSNGQYVLTYTGVKNAATKTADGSGVLEALTKEGVVSIATSTDGINWTNANVNAGALIQGGGSTPYAQGATAPSLYTSGTNLKLYFTGRVSDTGTYYSIIPSDLTEWK